MAYYISKYDLIGQHYYIYVYAHNYILGKYQTLIITSPSFYKKEHSNSQSLDTC